MRNALMTAFAVTVLLASTALTPALGEPKTTRVLSTELHGAEGMEANVVLFEVDPGWETSRHIHPGDLFIYVLDGTIEVEVEGEEPKSISAGEAFHEVPDKPMVGRNASSSEGARFVVFQVGEAGQPLMVEKPD